MLEKGREGKREEEKHQCAVASHMPPPGNLAQNPGICAIWGLNQGPFDSQADTQSTEPYQPGHKMHAYLDRAMPLLKISPTKIITPTYLKMHAQR